MSNLSFDFKAFIKESIDVLINTKSYFSTMKTTGGVSEPLIKALIYGAVAGIIGFLWNLVNLGGPVISSISGFMIIIWFIIGAIVGLFVGAVLLYIISGICRGSKDYEANVRVIAATLVLFPFNVLLSFTGGLNVIAGIGIMLAIDFFALYLLYHGLIQTLKANPVSVKIVIILLAILSALLMSYKPLKMYCKAKSINKELKEDLLKK
jgi:hypothetical protein